MKSCHRSPCFNLNCDVKRDKNSVLYGQFHRCPCRKERDGISAISLALPATCNVIIGAAHITRCLMAKARTSLAPILDFGDIRDAYAQVGVLSLRAKADRWCVSAICSSTNHASSSAAISKSEFVRDPVGLLSITTSLLTASGHSTRHTVCG